MCLISHLTFYFFSKITKESNCIAIFFYSYYEFHDLHLGRMINSAREVNGLYDFDGDFLESRLAQVASSSAISLPA